jgi:hypothetical protein
MAGTVEGTEACTAGASERCSGFGADTIEVGAEAVGAEVRACDNWVGRETLDAGFGCFGVAGREEVALELPTLTLLEVLFGRIPMLPAHTLQGQPMLLPSFSIKCSK